MTRRFVCAASVVVLSGCLGISTFYSSLAAQSSRPNTREVETKGECEDDLDGEYANAVFTIPGDGNVHGFSSRAPNRTSRLLGAYIKTKRNQIDPDFNATCPVNPGPATPETSLKRRCEEPSNDMSVEYCRFVGGSNSGLTCAFVNATGAGPKDIEIFACWSKPKK
jgi:hypothetical protein